jgi:hypothetical protein
MSFRERGFLNVEIISCDHQPFQINGVKNIICQECFEGTPVPVHLKLVPEEHCGISIESIESISVNSHLFFTPFEASPEPQFGQDEPQVYVGLIQLHMKRFSQERDVKTSPIIGYQELEIRRRTFELLEIVSLNEPTHGTSVIHGNGSDNVFPTGSTRCLDVKVSDGMTKLPKETPMLAG